MVWNSFTTCMQCYNIALMYSSATSPPLFPDLEQARAGTRLRLDAVLTAIPFATNGLIAAIAQQYDTREVLMLAWMNREALEETLRTGRACYWSRSRKALWRKGETSGCTQHVRQMRLDCDGDALLLLVDQLGPACHTGRPNCFYNQLDRDGLVVLVSPPQATREPGAEHRSC